MNAGHHPLVEPLDLLRLRSHQNRPREQNTRDSVPGSSESVCRQDVPVLGESLAEVDVLADDFALAESPRCFLDEGLDHVEGGGYEPGIHEIRPFVRELDEAGPVEVSLEVGGAVDLLRVVEVRPRSQTPEEGLLHFVFPLDLLRLQFDPLDLLLPAVNDEGIRKQELGLFERVRAVLVHEKQRNLPTDLIVLVRDILRYEFIVDVYKEVHVG